MQRIQLICVGKLKESYYIDACGEYAKRLGRYCALERLELPEMGDIECDGEAVLKKLTPDDERKTKGRVVRPPRRGSVVGILLLFFGFSLWYVQNH